MHPPQSPPRRAPTGRGPGSSGSGSAPGAVWRFLGRGLTVSCAPPGAAPLLVRGHRAARRPSRMPQTGATLRLLLCCGQAGPSNFDTVTQAQRWQRRRGGATGPQHWPGDLTTTNKKREKGRGGGGGTEEREKAVNTATSVGTEEFPVNTKAHCMGPRAEWVVVAWAASQRAANCELPHRSRALAP